MVMSPSDLAKLINELTAPNDSMLAACATAFARGKEAGAAAEREACARLVEELGEEDYSWQFIADAIRGRRTQ